jgi:hypothetical protein
MAGALDGVLAQIADWIEDNLLLDTVRITLPANGAPVLNETTGQLEHPDGTVLYEGPGAVLSSAALGELPGIPDATQAWPGATKSRYRMLTPLDAPLAPKDAIVTVTAVRNPANTALIGRSWICNDPSRVSTMEAVRMTVLDQNRVPGEGT